jgi:hypothetical protein
MLLPVLDEANKFKSQLPGGIMVDVRKFVGVVNVAIATPLVTPDCVYAIVDCVDVTNVRLSVPSVISGGPVCPVTPGGISKYSTRPLEVPGSPTGP